MAITRKNAGGIITVPVKAEAVISAGGFVLADASGYAVPGSDLSGGKFLGIAINGVSAAGVGSGVKSVKVYRQGLFKMAATSIAVTMQGDAMYCVGAATFDETSAENVCVGKLVKYVSATVGWIDIADTGSAGSTGSGLIAVVPSKTTSREENIAGLSSAITLCNDLKTKMNAHAADAGEHTTAVDNVNFPVAGTASTLANLKTQTALLLTAYAAHHVDARLTEAWAFHVAQGSNYVLVSAVAPTTLQECITRLNDLKAKYDLHDDDDTAHGTLADHAIAAANAAYGVAILVTQALAAIGDIVLWDITDDGTGNVTKVTAVAGTGVITFTFSADPQNDCVIQYVIARAV